MRIKTIQTSNKNFNIQSDVGMEKEQKQELGWRVSVLPIPAFHHCVTSTIKFLLLVVTYIISKFGNELYL